MSHDDRPDGGRTRVALSMLTLVRGGMGGSERYARVLTRELARHESVDAVALVPGPAVGFSQGVPEEAVPHVHGRGSTLDRLSDLVRSEMFRRRVSGLRHADVVHYPFTVPVPHPPRDVPYVQTLHDVQHLDLPGLFSREEIVFRRLMYDRGARQAAAVITVSNFTKGRAVETLGLDPAKVHVAPLGVDPPADSACGGEREELVLYPARPWPHKNHALLIRAMDLLRRERPSLRLVLTGGGLETLGPVPDWVERRGHVPDPELDTLYRRAACLAFPSLYEGFGLPTLEAMARGCPVAVARAGALPEVCGDAAVYFDPHDAAAVAAAVDQAIRERDRLVARGLRQVTLWRWDRCAQVHVDVYRRLHGQPA
ncbi:MAG TPA: glycosyltransferase family 1 protein [Nocardioidaceae bacterium]|nr:glycosyltransferase family 1 protein [Nocardioidaceae bacterium]